MNFVIHESPDEFSVVAHSDDPMKAISYARTAAITTANDWHADLLKDIDPDHPEPEVNEMFHTYDHGDFRFEIEIVQLDLKWTVHGGRLVRDLDY